MYSPTISTVECDEGASHSAHGHTQNTLTYQIHEKTNKNPSKIKKMPNTSTISYKTLKYHQIGDF